jgi:hypothetical protein
MLRTVPHSLPGKANTTSSIDLEGTLSTNWYEYRQGYSMNKSASLARIEG